MSVTSVTNYPDIHGAHVKIFNPTYESGQRPLALFNGIGAGNGQWGEFPEELDRTIVAIDVSKSVTKWLPSMEDYKDSALKVLDELEIDKFDALGLSWGALLTEQLALDARARLGRIVLISGGSCLPIMPPSIKSSMILAMPNYSAGYIEKHRQAVFGGKAGNDSELRYKLDMSRNLTDVHYRGQLISALGSTLNFFRLATSDVPSLLIASDDDPIISHRNIAIKNMITSKSTMYTHKRGGHLSPWDYPEETARVVNEFLDKPL